MRRRVKYADSPRKERWASRLALEYWGVREEVPLISFFSVFGRAV